jgi:hypothetical protein
MFTLVVSTTNVYPCGVYANVYFCGVYANVYPFGVYG